MRSLILSFNLCSINGPFSVPISLYPSQAPIKEKCIYKAVDEWTEYVQKYVKSLTLFAVARILLVLFLLSALASASVSIHSTLFIFDKHVVLVRPGDIDDDPAHQ